MCENDNFAKQELYENMNRQISHNTTNCIGSRMPMNTIVGGGYAYPLKTYRLSASTEGVV